MEWVANAKPRPLTPGRVTWYPLYRRGGGGPIAKFIRNDKSVLSVYKLTPLRGIQNSTSPRLGRAHTITHVMNKDILKEFLPVVMSAT